MNAPFRLTNPERRFLLHWTHEAKVLCLGPAFIWCVNQGVNPAYGPYPLAELFWDEERRDHRIFWTGDRPRAPFTVPWKNAEHFWERVDDALFKIPRLKGDPRFTPTPRGWEVECILSPAEAIFLRAYYREMVEPGNGPVIDLTQGQGISGYHLIPFFRRLDDLEHPPTGEVTYPWPDFPARYQELSGRRYESPSRLST